MPDAPDIAIIGGGPAGLMAAETAAKLGRRVTLFDAMPSVGRKFLLAGRGGLNLTHSEQSEFFLERYGMGAPRSETGARRLLAAGPARTGRPASARRPIVGTQRPRLSRGDEGLAPAARLARGASSASASRSRRARAGSAGPPPARSASPRRTARSARSRRARPSWPSAAHPGRGSARTAPGRRSSRPRASPSRRCAPPTAASPSPGRTSCATASPGSR